MTWRHVPRMISTKDVSPSHMSPRDVPCLILTREEFPWHVPRVTSSPVTCPDDISLVWLQHCVTLARGVFPSHACPHDISLISYFFLTLTAFYRIVFLHLVYVIVSYKYLSDYQTLISLILWLLLCRAFGYGHRKQLVNCFICITKSFISAFALYI